MDHVPDTSERRQRGEAHDARAQRPPARVARILAGVRRGAEVGRLQTVEKVQECAPRTLVLKHRDHLVQVRNEHVPNIQ